MNNYDLGNLTANYEIEVVECGSAKDYLVADIILNSMIVASIASVIFVVCMVV